MMKDDISWIGKARLSISHSSSLVGDNKSSACACFEPCGDSHSEVGFPGNFVNI